MLVLKFKLAQDEQGFILDPTFETILIGHGVVVNGPWILTKSLLELPLCHDLASPALNLYLVDLMHFKKLRFLLLEHLQLGLLYFFIHLYLFVFFGIERLQAF